MSNIQAAMLLNQLDNIDTNWQRREQICRTYEDAFRETPNIRCLDVLPGNKSARHLFTILVHPENRDDLLLKLQESEIGVAVNYRAIHLLKFYRETFGYGEGAFPIAEEIGNSTITLPLYPRLLDEEVDYVIGAVRDSI
jgi:dTDP-4-amino-4,6-dideoxygalactose transaminase